MTSFLLLSFLLLLFSFKRSSNLLLIISFIILFILSAFRGITVGTDTVNYYMLFGRTEQGVDIRTEKLWEVLSQLIIYFNGDFSVLIFISTLLVLIPVFVVAKRFSVSPLMTVFLYYTLYFYFFSLNITRQMIAVSLVLLACMFLIENRKRVFVIFIILASGFHLTALSALLLLLLNRIPDKDYVYYTFTGIAMFVGLFLSSYIFSLGGQIFGYLRYVEGFELGSIFGNFLYLMILNSFFFFIMSGIGERGTFFKLFFIFIIASNLLIRIPFGDRVVLYYAMIQIVYLPYFIYKTKINPRSLAFLLVLLYSYIMFFRRFGAGEILPYSNTLF